MQRSMHRQNFELFLAFKWISSPQLKLKFFVIKLPFAFLSFGSLSLALFYIVRIDFTSEQ